MSKYILDSTLCLLMNHSGGCKTKSVPVKNAKLGFTALDFAQVIGHPYPFSVRWTHLTYGGANWSISVSPNSHLPDSALQLRSRVVRCLRITAIQQQWVRSIGAFPLAMQDLFCTMPDTCISHARPFTAFLCCPGGPATKCRADRMNGHFMSMLRCGLAGLSPTSYQSLTNSGFNPLRLPIIGSGSSPFFSS